MVKQMLLPQVGASRFVVKPKEKSRSFSYITNETFERHKKVMRRRHFNGRRTFTQSPVDRHPLLWIFTIGVGSTFTFWARP